MAGQPLIVVSFYGYPNYGGLIEPKDKKSSLNDQGCLLTYSQ